MKMTSQTPCDSCTSIATTYRDGLSSFGYRLHLCDHCAHMVDEHNCTVTVDAHMPDPCDHQEEAPPHV